VDHMVGAELEEELVVMALEAMVEAVVAVNTVEEQDVQCVEVDSVVLAEAMEALEAWVATVVAMVVAMVVATDVVWANVEAMEAVATVVAEAAAIAMHHTTETTAITQTKTHATDLKCIKDQTAGELSMTPIHVSTMKKSASPQNRYLFVKTMPVEREIFAKISTKSVLMLHFVSTILQLDNAMTYQYMEALEDANADID